MYLNQYVIANSYYDGYLGNDESEHKRDSVDKLSYLVYDGMLDILDRT